MLKHPLLPVTACYATGVVAAAFVPVPLIPAFVLAGLVAMACFLWPRGRPWLLGVLAALVGALNLHVRTAALAPHDLRRVLGEKPALVTVRGVLVATPTLRVTGWEPDDSARSLALIEVSAVAIQTQESATEDAGAAGAGFQEELDDPWRAAAGRVFVSTPAVLDPGFFAGRGVEVFGVLHPPRPPRAPGLFDARAYFRWQGIYYQLETRDTNDWRLTAGPQPVRPPLPERFQVWARRTLARGLPAEDEALRLLWAMTLGWRTALTDEVAEPFMRSGTMHLFAISGLHVALIAGILVAVLRVLQMPRGATGLVAVPLLWFYTAATGWQASAVRSTLMMTVVITGWALKRPGNLLNSLAAAAGLILLGEPRQLFQASFQLSFCVVLSLALVLPPLVRARDRLLQTDPLLPADLLPRWRRWLDPPLRWMTLSLAISLAAWLGSLPLIAHYFHLVTPVSLLANVLVVPLGSLALMCNLGALFCGDWLPWLTGLFNHSAWFWMTGMMRLSEWAAALPLAYAYVPAPGVPALLAFYAALVGLASGWALRPGRRAACAAVAGLVLCGFGLQALRGRGFTNLTVLPLNGGAAIWVDAPGRGRDLLVDAGNEFAAERVVTPFLRAQGVNRLAHFALTHGDVRHTGGAALIETHFHPATIWTSPLKFRSPSYRAFVSGREGTAQGWQAVARGAEFAGWRVLHPVTEDRFSRADDSALVLRAEIAGWRVLLLSDLGRSGQEVLLAREPDLRADIVVTGLPAGEEPLAPTLLDAIQPRLVLVADDERPTSARAGPALRARLKRSAAPTLFLSDTGAVTLRLSRQGWRVEDVDGRCLHRGGTDR